jgi:hypothetical protein
MVPHRELETVGLRLNKKPPNIYFRKKVGQSSPRSPRLFPPVPPHVLPPPPPFLPPLPPLQKDGGVKFNSTVALTRVRGPAQAWHDAILASSS